MKRLIPLLAGFAAAGIFFIWLYHHNQYFLSFPMWLDAENLAESENQTAQVVKIEYDHVNDNLGELAEAEDIVVVSYESETGGSYDTADYQVDMLYGDGWVTVYRPFGLYGQPRGIDPLIRWEIEPGPNERSFFLPKEVLRPGGSYRLRFDGKWCAWFETD